MMREKARSSPRCAFRRTPRSGWVSDTGRRSIAPVKETHVRHLFGFRDAEKRQNGGRDVRKLASVTHVSVRIGDDERHRIRRMRSMRADAVVGDELLRVAVVGD